MRLQSMTGFSRSEGQSGRARWVWELRSVNGKGLDIRLRLPPGLDAVEVEARRLASLRFTRGNLQAGLTVTTEDAGIAAVINNEALDAILRLKAELGDRIDPAPLRFDTLLGMRGVIDLREPEEDPAARETRDADIITGLETALDRLVEMRSAEGEALAAILRGQIDRIEALALSVEADPSRSQEAIVARLAQQVAALTEASPALDSDRLHMEAAILATKADLREEIDRLKAHVAAARSLLDAGGPIGRKLDFLAQEFNRESNTICAKSVSVAVTAAGIELKVVIDQFREQIQNLE